MYLLSVSYTHLDVYKRQAQYGIEDFYAEKYLDTLRVGAETESDELFDLSLIHI